MRKNLNPTAVSCTLIVCCALLAAKAAAEPPPQPKDSFYWAGWQIPATKLEERGALSIVEDEAAESRRKVKDEEGKETEVSSALQIRVSRRAIAKQAIRIGRMPPIDWENGRRPQPIAWKTIVPGVYRLTARIKYSGDSNIIGTPVKLGIGVLYGKTLAEQDFHCFDIGEESEFHEISMLYEVDASLSKRLPTRRARHSWRYAGFLKDAYPDYVPPKEKKKPPPEGLEITVSLPRTKYSSFSGMPPNSVRTVSVDWVKFERIQPSPSLTVRHVRPQKRWIRPGDTQTFQVSVENYHPRPFGRTLLVTLHHGLAQRVELLREDLGLKPGESKVLSVPWETTPETPLWGYKVRAEILDGAKTEHSAHDVFSVHPLVHPVHIMGGNTRIYDPFREPENFQNLMEVFAATPGDCSRLMPKEDQWLCGMSIIPQSFKIVRATTDYNRSIGVATHMYLFAGGTGTPLMDMYIRRPEWAGGRLVATDEVYRMRKAVMQAIRKHDFSKGPFEMPKTPHIESGLNHWFPELMQKITSEALEFVDRSGYEGIRFDVGIFGPNRVTTVFGEPLPYKMEDAMKHAAQNFNGLKDALREKFPNFEFGANMDTWAYLERVGRRNEEAPDPETFPEFVAFARAGGMFMDEGTMSAPFYNHYMNRFEDALWGMCEKRAVARRYGGVYQLFSPHRNGRGHFAHDDIYWAIMIIASGSYYVGNFSAAPCSEGSPGEFITRFSEFFRSQNLQPLEGAEDKIYVDSPELLWYADPTVWEDIGNRRRYVIPLINPPVNDRLRRNKSNELPPPIDEPFPIEVQLPDGYRGAEAWMLTWEPRVEAKKLEPKVEGKLVKISFPGIKLFRTLVMEFSK